MYSKHISTLSTINNLAVLYVWLGKLDKAEKIFQPALQGYKKALETNFETYTRALNTVPNLGLFLIPN
jgi:tetratricopeptide (TPR) repeat protein